jgi:hypothetical protein
MLVVGFVAAACSAALCASALEIRMAQLGPIIPSQLYWRVYALTIYGVVFLIAVSAVARRKDEITRTGVMIWMGSAAIVGGGLMVGLSCAGAQLIDSTYEYEISIVSSLSSPDLEALQKELDDAGFRCAFGRSRRSLPRIIVHPDYAGEARRLVQYLGDRGIVAERMSRDD